MIFFKGNKLYYIKECGMEVTFDFDGEILKYVKIMDSEYYLTEDEVDSDMYKDFIKTYEKLYADVIKYKDVSGGRIGFF